MVFSIKRILKNFNLFLHFAGVLIYYESVLSANHDCEVMKMKKKTFLKFLPALLVAPILACCITVFATADEIEGQTFFNRLVAPIEQNYSNFMSILSNNEPSLSSANEDYVKISIQTNSSSYGNVYTTPTPEISDKPVTYIFAKIGTEIHINNNTITYVNEAEDTITVYAVPMNEASAFQEWVDLPSGTIITVESKSYEPFYAFFKNISPQDYTKQFKYNTSTEGGKEVAYITGPGDNIENAISNFTLYIPIKIPSSNDPNTFYEVVGISSGAFFYNGNDDLKNFRKVVINGWETNSQTGKKEGGWFRSIASNAFNGYYTDTETVSGDEQTRYTGGFFRDVVLPDCLTTLGPSCFQNCGSLRNIYVQKENGDEVVGFPSQLKKIGNKAFNDCSSLGLDNSGNQITFTLPNSLEIIDNRAFMHCWNLTNLVIGDGIKDWTDGTGANFSGLVSECFRDCISLQSVTIGKGMATLGPNTFYNCHALTNIDFNDTETLTTIDKSCFQNCTNLQELILPDSVDKLGDNAFENCYKLNNIQLNEGLTIIGEYCFSNQTQYAKDTTASEIEYIFLPESLRELHDCAFQNSQHLKEVIIGMQDAGNASISHGAFANCPELLSTTYLWNSPWGIQTGSYKGTTEGDKPTIKTAICEDTKALDVRFRPVIDPEEYGQDVDRNGFLDFYGESQTGATKNWTDIAPVGSRLMLIAAFDSDKYGNDLKKYLNESTARLDNATFETKNNNTQLMHNNVKYVVGITIPDVLTLRNTGTLKTYSDSVTPDYSVDVPKGERSKGIHFLYDKTEVSQTTHEGKEISRPADDGVLIINNNAIQVNSSNVLYVTYKSKSGEKSNPCVFGHSVGSSNNPFQNTYNFLTAEASLMDNLGQGENSNIKPIVCNNEPEYKIIDEEKPLLLSFGRAEEDVKIPNACCFFSKPGGEIEGTMYDNGKLSITDVTFGGTWTDNSLPDKPTTKAENECQLACVYNDGDLTMSGCVFKNSVGTWTGKTEKGDSYGGSCLFNFRSATVTSCTMDNCEANYDGGAVTNAGTLNMKSCIISNCKSARYGGAIFNNLGDGSDPTELTVDGCTFTNNNAGTGGAIHYWNGAKLCLDGNLNFSGNKDAKGTCDIFASNIKDSKDIQPFTLGSRFSTSPESPITLSVKQPKDNRIVCSGGASAVKSFTYQNGTFKLEASEGNIILKTPDSVSYSLAVAEATTGSWVDEGGSTITNFTAEGTTAPEVSADGKITYTDVAGDKHTITATPAEGYQFTSCEYNETTKTYTATFTAAELFTNQAKNFSSALKESIDNRNADPKENERVELIYGR